MCIGGGPSIAAAPPPQRPPEPPREEPLTPVLGDEAKEKNKGTQLAIKRRGRSALKVDLSVGGDPQANSANGLVVK